MNPQQASLVATIGGSHVQYATLAVSSLVAALLEVLSVAAIPLFITLLVDPATVKRQMQLYSPGLFSRLINDTDELIMLVSAGMITFFVVKNLFLALITLYQARFIANRQTALSTRLFLEFLHRPYKFHLTNNSVLLHRIVNTDAFSVFIGTVLPATQILTEGLVLLLVCLLLIYLNPTSSLAALGTMALLGWIFYRALRSRLGDLSRRQHKAGTEMNRWILQAFGGVKEVKLYGTEPFFAGAYRQHALEYSRNGAFMTASAQIPRFIMETLVMSGIGGAVLIMAARGLPIHEILPSLALFGVAALRLLPAVNRIIANASMIRFNSAGLDTVVKSLAENHLSNPDHKVAPTQQLRLNLTKSFSAENICYEYPNAARSALNGISFEVKKGGIAGIVGPSGAGKSTLIDVILGLHPPSAGTVAVDGCDVRSMLDTWQRSIGYVPQNIFMLDDTIRRNIAFGVPDDQIDDKLVWDCLRKARLDGFVQNLADGLETSINEDGSRLSGGQRQRLGIARALFRRPEVLILDEATSALDNQTEKEFGLALSGLTGETTVILVAHRLNTVKRCDLLIHLQDGTLIGTGTFESLMQSSSHFRKLMGTANE